jgi:hypothetical protein
MIRRTGSSGADAFRSEVAINVSLAGVYFETEEPQAYTPNDIVTASVSIPEEQTSEFPFTRLAGRGRVVRVKDVPSTDAARPRAGIALEFGEDLTALSAVPSTRRA